MRLLPLASASDITIAMKNTMLYVLSRPCNFSRSMPFAELVIRRRLNMMDSHWVREQFGSIACQLL